MEERLKQLPILAQEKFSENKKYFERLRNKTPKHLDQTVEKIHDEVFSKTDCTQCANCCKTTGPLFKQKDIERLAAHKKIRPAEFVTKYLRVDEDGDFVLQKVPCVFLDQNNLCTVYDIRPQACREYPHTNRKKIYQIADMTLKNVAICPAAFEIVERIKKQLPLF